MTPPDYAEFVRASAVVLCGGLLLWLFNVNARVRPNDVGRRRDIVPVLLLVEVALSGVFVWMMPTDVRTAFPSPSVVALTLVVGLGGAVTSYAVAWIVAKRIGTVLHGERLRRATIAVIFVGMCTFPVGALFIERALARRRRPGRGLGNG